MAVAYKAPDITQWCCHYAEVQRAVMPSLVEGMHSEQCIVRQVHPSVSIVAHSKLSMASLGDSLPGPLYDHLLKHCCTGHDQTDQALIGLHRDCTV